MKIQNIEKIAETVIDHAKALIHALHGEDEAKKLLPQLGEALKKKAESLLAGNAPKA